MANFLTKSYLLTQLKNFKSVILDNAYLGKTAKASSASTADSATKATQDGNGNTITYTYMKQYNPTGNGSFSLNRKADATIGDYSFAEGYITIASGTSSHSEGHSTTAIGNYSHAEGYSTNELPSTITPESVFDVDDIKSAWDTKEFSLAWGDSSHVEGRNNIAYGTSSHAEGFQTIASGDASHAEGYCTEASHVCSHAEGDHTAASKWGSHAEGGNTIASADYQHVQGKYNANDSNAVHIVGWGTSDSNRKNIHTIDKNGYGYFKGGVNSWEGTQAQYNALSTKDPKIDYYITDGNEDHADAFYVNFNNTLGSGLSATNVQSAIDEISSNLIGVGSIVKIGASSNITCASGTTYTIASRTLTAPAKKSATYICIGNGLIVGDLAFTQGNASRGRSDSTARSTFCYSVLTVPAGSSITQSFQVASRGSFTITTDSNFWSMTIVRVA